MPTLELKKIDNNDLRNKVKTAATNIRREIRAIWPKIKELSVRSDHFSQGNSINISWTDGPTSKQVDEVVNKYQEGHMNGMEDIYEYSKDFDSAYGGTKYVCTQRDISDEAKNAVSKHLKENGYQHWEEDGITFPHYENNRMTTQDHSLEKYMHRHMSMSQWMYQETSKRSFVHGYPGDIPLECSHYTPEPTREIEPELESLPESITQNMNPSTPTNEVQSDLFDNLIESEQCDSNVIPFHTESEEIIQKSETPLEIEPQIPEESVTEEPEVEPIPDEIPEEIPTLEDDETLTEKEATTSAVATEPEQLINTEESKYPQEIQDLEHEFYTYDKMYQAMLDTYEKEEGKPYKGHEIERIIKTQKSANLTSVTYQITREIGNPTDSPALDHYSADDTPYTYYDKLVLTKDDLNKTRLTSIARSLFYLTYGHDRKNTKIKTVKGRIVLEQSVSMEDGYGSKPKSYCYSSIEYIQKTLGYIQEFLRESNLNHHINTRPKCCEYHGGEIISNEKIDIGSDITVVTFKNKIKYHISKEVAKKLQIFLAKYHTER